MENQPDRDALIEERNKPNNVASSSSGGFVKKNKYGDREVDRSEEYTFFCGKVRLIWIIRIVAVMVYSIGMFSLIRMIQDMSRTGSRDKIGSFFSFFF